MIPTNGTTYSTSDLSVLKKILDEKITGGIGHYSNLKITDTLSEYVDFYTSDLDFSIDKIVTNSSGTVISDTTLYEYNETTKSYELTDEGKKYIKEDGVTIDYTNKSITVEFVDTYEQISNTYFRTSFNVVTTKTAYDEYETNMKNVAKTDTSGYEGVKGDDNTDYPDNSNSSNNPGFYSNEEAKIYYSQALSGDTGTIKSADYAKPVIQVNETVMCDLNINKNVEGANTTQKFNFELTVKDSSGTAVNMTGKTLPEGVSIKDGTTNVLQFSISHGNTCTLEGLIPLDSQLTLEETDYDGFNVSMNIQKQNYAGASQTFTINTDFDIVVNNVTGARLPETGGVGEEIFVISGLLMIAYAVSKVFASRKSKNIYR